MRGRSGFAIGVVTFLLAACGSGSPAATAGPTPGPTTASTVAPITTPALTEAPGPTGPATFQLTVAGDPRVTVAWQTGNGINCSNPTLAGLNILTFATSPDGQVTLVLTFTSGQVSVSERAGSGTTYTAREFKGTGVSGFDPARGVAFDSAVEIVPTPAINAGTLGTISHVSGSVDCAGQTTGTSSVVASGASAEGAVTGPFTQFRIVCTSSTADGNTANIIAVMDTLTPPTYFIVGLPSNGNATMFTIAGAAQKQHTYVVDKAGTSSYTVTATGLHLDADFTEVVAQGATEAPHVIHLAGDATCGTFNKS